MAQIVTASRLADGIVVFLDAEGGWSDRLDHASVLTDTEAAATALARGKAAEAENLVVDAYAVDVAIRAGCVVPLKLREVIRARGPTILPAFTKPGSRQAPVLEDDHVSV